MASARGGAGSRPATVATIAAREEDSRLILTVENDRGPPAAATGETGTGVGLVNVRERLAARFGRGADCEAAPLPG